MRACSVALPGLVRDCSAMKRVLVVRLSLNPPGGGKAVAAWMIQALRGVHHVGVLSWVPVDLAAINRHFGTSLQPSDVTLHTIPAALARLVPRDGLERLKYSYLLRLCRKLRADYDVFIGVNNEADFGVPGIQYIHYTGTYDSRLHPRGIHSLEAATAGSRQWPLHTRIYFWMCNALSGWSVDRMHGNLTLANSDWTRRRAAALHGVKATTLYPPVPVDFAPVPWDERENGFVCVGRIVPSKELETIIAILADVRRRGHQVHLRIIGSPTHREYYGRIRRLQAEHAAWVHLDTNLTRTELTQLVARHKYGIHAMRLEHFGIAVGEMVNAGCIVFVPNDGGQIEIIGDRPELIFSSRADAVEKIDRVLRDPDQQDVLRAQLAECKATFSADEFIRKLRAIVAEFPTPARKEGSPVPRP